jgi:hypothetical protein
MSDTPVIGHNQVPEDWKPGSFTKNFSWGPKSGGLIRLHESIRLGFEGVMANIPRSTFRERLRAAGLNDYIPMNFFLFNHRIDGTDYIVADEIVFQALTFEHSTRFDKLAMFALNFSYAGKFARATVEQRRPALWAHHYIRDRLGNQLNWDTSKVNADDIDAFLKDSPQYKGQISRRKTATNLNYLYEAGRLNELRNSRIERWWVDSLFLALDRVIDDRKLDQKPTPDAMLAGLLRLSGFSELTGPRSLERELGAEHVIRLYAACGGRDRFSAEHVKQISEEKLLEFAIPNNDDPQGAVHPTNPRILKSIPRICAMLAKDAGFDIIDADDLANFDLEKFNRDHTRVALRTLKDQGIKPTMTANELLKLTRGS